MESLESLPHRPTYLVLRNLAVFGSGRKFHSQVRRGHRVQVFSLTLHRHTSLRVREGRINRSPCPVSESTGNVAAEMQKERDAGSGKSARIKWVTAVRGLLPGERNIRGGYSGDGRDTCDSEFTDRKPNWFGMERGIGIRDRKSVV